MVKQNDKLSKAELKLMARLLTHAAELSSADEDSNFIVPASVENKALFKRYIKEVVDEEEQDYELRQVEDEKDELSEPDWSLFHYFADRCAKLAKK